MSYRNNDPDVEAARRQHRISMCQRRIRELKLSASVDSDNDRRELAEALVTLMAKATSVASVAADVADWDSCQKASAKVQYRLRRLRNAQKLREREKELGRLLANDQ